MEKTLKLTREARITYNNVILKYKLEGKSLGSVQLLTGELLKIFPSLTEEEIKERVEKVLKDVTKKMSVWEGEISLPKDKEEIEKTHKEIVEKVKELIKELSLKEKERNLSQWLWYSWEEEIKIE